MVLFTRAVVIASCILSTTKAFTLWPFKEKRFKDEGFIFAGGLGLEGFTGSVVAFGDWDGDQS
jgi:integrin alpha FG-GAP repeat containing protein 1